MPALMSEAPRPSRLPGFPTRPVSLDTGPLATMGQAIMAEIPDLIFLAILHS
jgi:hypothetical protein